MPSPQTYRRERQRLAERLRAVREGTGLSGNRFARELGWIQSRLSKIETGTQLPTEDDIRHWVSTAGVPELTDDLLTLLERARAEYGTWRRTYRDAGGGDRKQADIAALEHMSTRISGFYPAVIPGLLQTAEYARELLARPWADLVGIGEADVDRIVERRLERQRVLYAREKQIRIVVMEEALRSRICTLATLAGQLDRLIAVAGLPTVDFGVVPTGADLPVFPLHSFDLYDDLVVVELVTGEQQLSDPAEVATYAKLLDLLRGVAVTGREAVAVIQRVLTDLQQNTRHGRRGGEAAAREARARRSG